MVDPDDHVPLNYASPGAQGPKRPRRGGRAFLGFGTLFILYGLLVIKGGYESGTNQRTRYTYYKCGTVAIASGLAVVAYCAVASRRKD